MNQWKNKSANRFAKDCMVEALIQLLEKKSIDEISITELTERAGVSRMTYYRNYISIEDVFEQHLKDLIEDYAYYWVEKYPRVINYNLDALTECMKYFQKHIRFAAAFLHAGLEKQFLNILTNEIIELYKLNGTSKGATCHAIAISGAFFNFFSIWIYNNISLTPRQMAEQLIEVLPEK